ncbi:MAG TPA: FAD-dependent oxidoreductase [Caulobacteraceae bacterium]|jgi:D-arginine dehydrogenase|nr:FAD-dependent oxidoreductase [Caulobacteraceae bacterium]
MAEWDFLVVGSGIAGASAAAMLSAEASVTLIERESAHGYHTTGRSAALYAASYGGVPIRALTRASRAFYDAPPEGFAAHPLLGPRGCLYIARPDQRADLEHIRDASVASGVAVEDLGEAQALALCPVLRPGYVARAALEPEAMDIDVDALHQGYLRLFRSNGGVTRLSSELVGLQRDAGGWIARLSGGETLTARAVIDAAGAWADRVAVMAGVRPIGLMPLKRTAVLLDEPPGVSARAWPAVIDAGEQFYFKPESGKILASPADEQPSEPCDAYPDDMDVAIGIDRVQQAADIPVRRVGRSWAGLRTFAPDRSMVVGYDTHAPGFFWLAGQGGYGVQTAPAAARLAAALALRRDAPADIRELGLDVATVSPARFS